MITVGRAQWERLKAELRTDEGTGPMKGKRFMPYRCTSGKLTIGYGRNIDDKGISRTEAEILLENDMQEAVQELVTALPWVELLDWPRQAALINMLFNMGLGDDTRGLLSFKNTLALIRAGRYAEAAANIRKSKYARDTGPRAMRIAKIIEGGGDG